LLDEKTTESFERVFTTKVNGALVLAEKLRTDVQFVVFFSSTAAVFGNRGQIDYAAANDALDQIARWLNRRIAGRAFSVNWGPWKEVGMVSPELQREYAKRGIGLIDPPSGVASLLDEIFNGQASTDQVILMAQDGLPFATHQGGEV
jgi:NAD(P)-dependent dehydrogenase (short-subunit alcohol dehydrogenase family)